MKYLALITLSLILFSCENQGKKVVKEDVETETAAKTKVKNVSIKGTIMSSNDSTPLSMAMILVPGTTIGTMSAGEGKFMINAPEGIKKLVFVMDGYEKAEVEINPEEENTVYLNPKN